METDRKKDEGSASMNRTGSFTREGYLHENYRYFHLRDTAGQERDYHYHEFDKLLILLSGRVDYGIEEERYSLRPWDIMLVSHHTIHKALIDRAEPYERVIVYFDRGFVRRVTGGSELLSCFERAEGKRRYLLRPSEAGRAELRGVLDAYEAALRDERFGASAMRDTLFLQLLICVNRLSEEEGGALDTAVRPGDAKIAAVMSYMTEHMSESMTVEELAAQAYLSKYHFMRLFKAQTGETVHGWLRQRRLLYAAHAIRSGVPAVKAAEDSGFSDYSTFYRAFRDSFGVAPNRLK